MQKISLAVFFILIVLVAGFNSCEDSPPSLEPNPEEFMTTFILILTPDNGGDKVVLSYEDLDGEKGNPPSYLVDPLPANTTFTAVIQALDKTLSPIVDVTLELQDEKEGHQVFFRPEGVDLNISYADTDGDGNPVGLTSRITSGGPATGRLKVTLKHEPEKTAIGVTAGDITNAGGSIDIEANFPISIQ